MKKSILLVSVCLFVSLVGCATVPPATYDFEKTKVFKGKTYDQCWVGVMQYFSSLGNPIKNMDKASGFISTESNLTVNSSAMCDCGKAGFGLTPTNTIGNYNVLVRKISENETAVDVNAFFILNLDVVNLNGGLPGHTTLKCNSKGAIEKEIFEYIENAK